MVDTIGKHIEVNPCMSEIFGYSKEELEEMSVIDLTYPEDRLATQEYIERSLRGEKERAVFEKRFLHKNGELNWARA